MLAAGLEALFDLIRDGVAVKILGIKSNHPRRVVLDVKGEPQRFDLEAPPRSHTLLTLPSLLAAFERYQSGVSEASPVEVEGDEAKLVGATIWVAEHQVFVVLDDSIRDRLHSLTMPLVLNPLFATLKGDRWRKQPEMIDFIRHDLAGSLLSVPDLAKILRTIKFNRSSETRSDVQLDSKNLGKDVSAKISGTADLPENVKVKFLAYPSLAPDFTHEVEIDCTLFIDLDKELMRLSPKAGEMDRAMHETLMDLAKHVSYVFEGQDTFVGTP